MENVVIKDRRRRKPLKTGALHHAILNSDRFASIATDERGVIQIFSAGAARMLGYTEAEVANQCTAAQLCDPTEAIERARALSLEFGAAVDPGFEALAFKAARGLEDTHEVTWLRKDRSRLAAVVSVIALRDGAAAIIGYLLIAADNTAQQSFRRMVQSVTDCGIVQLDAQGKVLSWNAGAEILDGYGAHEILGQPFSRFYCAEDVERGAPQQDLAAAAAAGRYETEAWRLRRDGSTYRASIVLTALRDRASVLLGFARLTRGVSAVAPIAAKAGATGPPPLPGGIARRSLLYVEDQSANASVVEELVARRGDVVLRRAADADLGIELARSTRPEAILLNIDLPGIAALQFIKRLRADPRTQDTPLLALGTNVAPAAATQALEAGFFYYLTKPLNPERFMHALDDALEFAAREKTEHDERAFASAHTH